MKLNHSELYYNLGYILHQQGNWSAAVEAYQQAVQLNPSFGQAHQGLAIALAKQGQLDVAIQRYQQVVALQPDATEALNNLGCLLTQQGEFRAAQQAYQQAIKQRPDWSSLYVNYGRSLESTDPVAAINAYDYALRLQPDLIAAHYSLGQLLLKQKQHATAISAFERLLQIDPAHLEAHVCCGSAHLELGNWQQALQHFKQAILPQQEQIAAFCVWVEQLSGVDELTLARKAACRFLQALLPQNISAARQTVSRKSQLRPSVLLELPELPEAPSSLIASNENSSKASQLLCRVYLHWGHVMSRYGGTQQQQAERYYQQALRLLQETSDASENSELRLHLYLHLGDCLIQQQRWNAALILYHAANFEYPDVAQFDQRIGQILEQQQRWHEAISYYQRALSKRKASQFDQASDHQRALSKRKVSQFDQASIEAAMSGQMPGQGLHTTIQGYCSTLAWISRKITDNAPVTRDPNSRYVALSAAADHLYANLFYANLSADIAAYSVTEISSQSNQSYSNGFSDECASCTDHDCQGLNCQRCLQDLTQQFAPLQQVQGVYACCRLPAITPIAYFTAEISQAQAWITPCQSPWLVSNAVAVLTPDQQLLTDVSREYPDRLPNCTRSDSTFQRILAAPARQPEKISGRVAVLAGLSGHNYFHWLVDVLPRLELLRCGSKALSIDWSTIDWFWINHTQAPFQQQTLQRLGIPVEKILSSDQSPYIQADRLVVPSFAGHLGWAEPWVLAFLRRTFLPLAAQSSEKPVYERIYISRDKAHHRRLLNEAAVLKYLHSRGFVAVELESLSLAEQIALFANAKAIVAPHGGGLANLIFCNPGTTIIELFAPNYIRHYYWWISQQLGLNHYFLLGDTFPCSPIHRLMYPSPLMEDIWLDLNLLQRTFSYLEGKI